MYEIVYKTDTPYNNKDLCYITGYGKGDMQQQYTTTFGQTVKTNTVYRAPVKISNYIKEVV